jgi:hypothetical protein
MFALGRNVPAEKEWLEQVVHCLFRTGDWLLTHP